MKKVKEIFLPDLGEGIDSATISEISVSNEQTIKKDDIIIVLESEKASMEIPSEVDGIVKSINVENGQEIKTGELLLTIETENLKEKEVKKPTTNKEQVEPNTTNHENINLKTKHPSDTGGIYASPGVRRLARELNINLDIMSGSGNKGRITKEDLHGYIKAKMYAQKTPPTHLGSDVDFNQWGETDVKKLTKIKIITGSRLTRAWQTIPHVTQFIEAEVTSLDLLRKKEKEKLLKKDIKVTMMSFLMKATVNTLKEYP
ncbi:2-oxo acid dehydrogenase subunit E2, partial [Candidatus Marinimicrobia bacterium]|nr:2-oxo acid dehydrogenase subunit E2 [Candidatus Neomarinimicrobiota bacterium]